MTTVAGHTGAHVTASALMAGGSIVAGVVRAPEDGRAAVFTSIACRSREKTFRLLHKSSIKLHKIIEDLLSAVIPGGQVQV